MNEGALVIADCLGFRGIWNRVDPQQLIDRLRFLEAEASKRVVPKYSSTMLSFGPIRIHFRFLSDTAVLSVQYAPLPNRTPNEAQLNLLVSVACESASVLAKLLIDHDLSLPLRGCISFGEHLCEGNFLIGPAVDQAAEYMSEPEGAFIWVLPSAAERYGRFLERSLEIVRSLPAETMSSSIAAAEEKGLDGMSGVRKLLNKGSEAVEAVRMTFAQLLAVPIVIDPYPMPIKRGGFIDAAVVNPLATVAKSTDRQRIVDHYDRFLQGNRIDIWTKRQNTLKFLQSANASTAKFESSFGSGETLK